MVQIPETVGEWRDWLGGSVLPYWTATVAAEPVGYVEYLSPDGQPDRRPEKTPLVTGRLIYAFSHAYVLGLSQKARAAAEHGFRFLTERCWDAQEGGFFHAVTADGTPVDRRKDAYDHAFALFAMAWLHRATASREPLDWASRTIDFMDNQLVDRSNGGYREYLLAGESQPLPRRQNPHMHRLEAFHALYEATHDGVWGAHASAMVDLFVNHFLDRETGTLAEFFAGDWGPAPGAAGMVREPGHHFEWVWLLHQHVRLMEESRVLAPAEQLYRFAVTHGLDRDSRFVPAAFDEVDRMGRVVTDSKLLWPQTEAIKAFLARWEFLGDAEAAQHARDHLGMLFRWFLIDSTGRWRNRLARDGKDLSPDLPVRVFYHLFLCLAETLRLWPTLPGSAATEQGVIRE